MNLLMFNTYLQAGSMRPYLFPALAADSYFFFPALAADSYFFTAAGSPTFSPAIAVACNGRPVPNGPKLTAYKLPRGVREVT
jgi:hypothetical protein